MGGPAPLDVQRRAEIQWSAIRMADIAQSTFTPLVGDPRPEPRTRFETTLNRFLDDLFAALPTYATAIGFHLYDDRWPDVSEAGRTGRLAM